MFDRNEQWPNWIDQPFKLTMNEVENPLAVVEDFFDHDYLSGNKSKLWNMFKSTITGKFFNSLSAKERDNIAHFYELLERLIEANFLVNEHRRVGNITYIKKDLSVLNLYKPYNPDSDKHQENHNQHFITVNSSKMKSNIRNAKVHAKIVPRQFQPKMVPWLNLSGQWLAKAGFNAGDNISIIVSRKYLRISKQDSQIKTK